MKKLIILLLFISTAGYSQYNLEYINSNDSLEIKQIGTLERIFLFSKTKGIEFPDGSIQSTASEDGFPDAPSDSKIYGRENENWVEVKTDSSWDEIDATVANIDTAKTINIMTENITASESVNTENIEATKIISERTSTDTLYIVDQYKSDSSMIHRQLDESFERLVISDNDEIQLIVPDTKEMHINYGALYMTGNQETVIADDFISLNAPRVFIGSGAYDIDIQNGTMDMLNVDIQAKDGFFSNLFGAIGSIFEADTGRFDNADVNSITMGVTTVTGFTDSKTAIEGTVITNLNFKDTTFTDHSEARQYYDEYSNSFVFENDISGYTYNLGEVPVRVYNNTGRTILTNKAVIWTGTHTNGVRVATVNYAGNGSKDSSQVYAITTTEMLDESYGMANIIGVNNFANTSNLTTGKFYLAHEGNITSTPPEPPLWYVELGQNLYTHADSGVLQVNIKEPYYKPFPLLALDTSGIAQDITITTQNVWYKLPIGSLQIRENIGFEIAGDSIRPLQNGYYPEIKMDLSFGGNAAAEVWEYGIFKNGVKQRNKTRSTSSSAFGDGSVDAPRYLTTSDWISFKIRNTSGTGDPTIQDVGVKIVFSYD